MVGEATAEGVVNVNEVPIGICQLESRIGTEDYDPRPDNLAHALDAIATADDQGAKIMVFGEIMLNGYESGPYTPKYAVAESEHDPFVAPLVREARERDVYIIMGATTHKGAFPGDCYNSALVIGPEGLLGVYSKTHVAAFIVDGGAKLAAEKVWWSPGNELPVFDTRYGRIGIEICYDNWFPEVARTLTLKGAELIINVSAAVCGFEDGWGRFLATRSLENCVPFLHVSVVGKQKDFELFGGSRLFSPTGDLVFEAPRGEEAVLTTTLDRSLIFAARGAYHPFYNRNPALYEEVTKVQGPPQTGDLRGRALLENPVPSLAPLT
ncbi:MAG: 5-aminopentanamidase [Acidimicrobiaceae bacterium]